MKKLTCVVLLLLVCFALVAKGGFIGTSLTFQGVGLFGGYDGKRIGVEANLSAPLWTLFVNAADGKVKPTDILSLPLLEVNGYIKVWEDKKFGFKLGLLAMLLGSFDFESNQQSAYATLAPSLGFDFKFNQNIVLKVGSALPFPLIINRIAEWSGNGDKNWEKYSYLFFTSNPKTEASTLLETSLIALNSSLLQISLSYSF